MCIRDRHYDERVLELDKQIFTINGQFDAQHVQVGAIIPLQNEVVKTERLHVLIVDDVETEIEDVYKRQVVRILYIHIYKHSF